MPLSLAAAESRFRAAVARAHPDEMAAALEEFARIAAQEVAYLEPSNAAQSHLLSLILSTLDWAILVAQSHRAHLNRELLNLRGANRFIELPSSATAFCNLNL